MRGRLVSSLAVLACILVFEPQDGSAEEGGPVDIYAQAADGTLEIVEPNLDECVLCRLCIDAAPPGTVTVRKLYDDGAPL